MPTTTFQCECFDFLCDKSVELPIEVAQEIIDKGYFVIVDGCQTGPSKLDRLIEKRNGYSLYA